VLIAACDQLTTALAVIELDGLARRLVLCTPDLPADHLSHVIAGSQADGVVHDLGAARNRGEALFHVGCNACSLQPRCPIPPRHTTEWILLTSGTTGLPKLVVHTLETLTAAIGASGRASTPQVWSTFYDIRRYGGLQILLRALLSGTPLVLSDARETIGAHLRRAAESAVTHLTGTPSHWRRAILDPAARALALRYVRLSGEIADQAILQRLRLLFPAAKLVHAFASTEAGVGFEVRDGQEGFPAKMIDVNPPGIELKIVDGCLCIRSRGTALGYLGAGAGPLRDAEGFVNTGDLVERQGDRYYFAGRRGGIVNVGGLKVHPEEVEAVINQHPDVHACLVRGRRSPVTGAVLIADVVLRNGLHEGMPRARVVRDEILQACRDRLARHKTPVTIRFVPVLALSAAGKTARDA
jgi:acyl-CoA synthetase (AMP-forming)/AMP-acid ligase II